MTAIDWLDNELQKEMTIENAPGRSYVMIPLDTYMNRKAQAKKMEKEQIIDANYDGQRLHSKSCTKQMLQDNAESYFAETYGSNGSDEHIVDTNEMIPEISDEEIEAAIHKIYGRDCEDFYSGAIWYREQLKQR